MQAANPRLDRTPRSMSRSLPRITTLWLASFCLWVAPLLPGLSSLGNSADAGGLIVVTKQFASDAIAPPDRRRPPKPGPQPIPRPLPPRPMPIVRPTYRFAPLQTKTDRITVTIQGQVATTFIDQTFYNPNRARLEGDFIFPLPVGAQIDEFTMDVNGKQQPAELLDAKKARKIYTDIVRSQQDPALLEYVGRGMLKCRIFPIEPMKEKRVTLKYTQVLKSDSGLIGYQFPLNTKKYSAGPIGELTVDVTIASNQIIKSVYSPSHEALIKRPSPAKATMSYRARNTVPNTDFHVYFSTQPKNGADIGLNLMVFNDEITQELQGKDGGGYFMLLASPGVPDASTKPIAKDVVFVMDTSGSMAADRKLDQAKKALEFCIQNLNDEDRFQVVRFSTEVESLFGGLVPADDKHRDVALKFTKKLRPIGGTAINEALTTALVPLKDRADTKHAKRPYTVIFLTDGRPTIGNTNEDGIVKNVSTSVGDQSARVFCFGIGTDINTHLLDKITEKTKAVSQYVLPSEDIELKVSSFYTKINHPVLANLKVQVVGKDGKDAKDDPTDEDRIRISGIYPHPMPDLFKGDQLVILGRFTGSGKAEIKLQGDVNGETRTFLYDANFTSQDVKHQFIPRMWATRRVGYMLDQIRLHGESKELKDEVTRLAREYGIVTPYTAYLIVEDEAMRNVPVEARNLRRLEADRDALQQTRGAWRALKEAKSGREGVANAESAKRLKQADKLDASDIADDTARKVSGLAKAPAKPSSSPTSPTPDAKTAIGGSGGGQGQTRYDGRDLTSETRFVNGRNFFRNDNTWTDALCQGVKKDAKRIQVTFNSEAYFDLMIKHPDAIQWMSLGKNVQLVLDGVLYEITEKPAKDQTEKTSEKKKASK